MGGQEHEGKIWIDRLDPAQDLEPVHVRHVEVAEHDVRPLGTDLGEPRLAGREERTEKPRSARLAASATRCSSSSSM